VRKELVAERRLETLKAVLPDRELGLAWTCLQRRCRCRPPVDLARVGNLSHLHRPRVGAIGSVRKVSPKLVATDTQMG
jgi:hypothetical protein